MPKKPNKDNPKCPICSNISVKNGIKRMRLRAYQRFLCKHCNRYLTLQPQQQKSKTYPLQTILTTISNYNLGQPLRKQSIPKSTIRNWIKNINLPMNRLRNQLKETPKHEIIKKHRFIHHKQPFLYQYHNLKLDFAKKFPQLINYIKTIPTQLPKQVFNNSERISKISKETSTMAGEPGDAPSGVPHPICRRQIGRSINVVGVSLKEKQNYAVKLARIAISITKDNKKRHDIIENFMLINDTATIATEIPVYLKKNEVKLNQNLTGHIDILQIRFRKIYILDYKPEPVNEQQTINQLKLYRKALSKRTSIPKYKIKLAFFNDKGYMK